MSWLSSASPESAANVKQFLKRTNGKNRYVFVSV